MIFRKFLFEKDQKGSSKLIVVKLAIVADVWSQNSFVVVEKFFEGDHTIVVLIRVVDQMISCCFERVAVFGVEKFNQLFEIQGSIFVLVVGGEMFLVGLFVLKEKCQIFDQKGHFYDYKPILSQ